MVDNMDLIFFNEISLYVSLTQDEPKPSERIGDGAVGVEAEARKGTSSCKCQVMRDGGDLY